MNDQAERPSAAHAAAGLLLRNPLVHAALIVLLGLAAYGNTFHAEFQLDDYRRMLDLPYVRDLGYLTDWSVLQRYAAEHGFRVRFVGYLSFALNYAAGGADVVGYHLANLAIHMGNALLVYFLVRLTFRTPFFESRSEERGARSEDTPYPEPRTSDLDPRTSNLIPLLAALLFVSHPVQTEAVTYVVQRLASLATLFCLASLLFYVKARLALQAQGWKVRAVLGFSASVAAALLAMGSKEIAFTFPLAVCLYEFLFFRGGARRRAACLVPLLLTMLVIPLNILVAPGAGGLTAGHADEVTRVVSDLSRTDYLFTELRVIVTYVRLLFLPVDQNLSYDYPVFRSLFAPQVFLSLLFLLALAGLAVYLYYRSGSQERGTRNEERGSELETQKPKPESENPVFPSRLDPRISRLISFGILWFFLTLAVESSIIPIIDVIFEHRLYLPSVGAFIALAASCGLLGERFAGRVRGGEKMALALAALVILALASASYARNEVWRSQESLWRDVVMKSPGKSFGYQGLGMALAERGDLSGAFANFDRALLLDPGAVETHINRGTLYARAGRYDRAIADFTRATELDPSLAEAWNNLGLAWSESGNQEKAIPSLARAVALDPDNAQAHNNLGLALARKGRSGEAIASYDRAIALKPDYARAWFNRGSACRETGRPDRASADFKAACALGDERGCRELQQQTGR
jgi:tetratricopeptide (TPR) repeat protein